MKNIILTCLSTTAYAGIFASLLWRVIPKMKSKNMDPTLSKLFRTGAITGMLVLTLPIANAFMDLMDFQNVQSVETRQLIGQGAKMCLAHIITTFFLIFLLLIVLKTNLFSESGLDVNGMAIGVILISIIIGLLLNTYLESAFELLMPKVLTPMIR